MQLPEMLEDGAKDCCSEYKMEYAARTPKKPQRIGAKADWIWMKKAQKLFVCVLQMSLKRQDTKE